MLTPIDIQNHSLKTAVRGYSKKETDDFLEEILQGYESLYKENRELKDKVTSLSEGVQYYKQMETTLQKALVLAEKTSAETQEAAKSKADAMTNEAQAKSEAMTNEAQARAESMLAEPQTKANSILTEAQTKADSLLKEAHAEADGLRKEIHAYSDITKAKANRELEETRNHVRKLVQSYETYRLQFKKLAESQIEMLESENYSIFVPELAEMLDDAPDADTAMETQKTIAINLKSSEQIASETGRAIPQADSSVTEAAFKEQPPVLAETAAGQESIVNNNIGQAVHANDIVPASIETTSQTIQASDVVPESIVNARQEIQASDIVPGSVINTGQVIQASDIVPGNAAAVAGQEIQASDIVPGSAAVTAGQEIRANDIVPGSAAAVARQEIQASDIVPGSAAAGQVIQANDIAEQAIQATDVVPGNPAAVRPESNVRVQPDTTPRIQGYEGVVTKTVMPNNDSPFTFIDTE